MQGFPPAKELLSDTEAPEARLKVYDGVPDTDSQEPGDAVGVFRNSAQVRLTDPSLPGDRASLEGAARLPAGGGLGDVLGPPPLSSVFQPTTEFPASSWTW